MSIEYVQGDENVYRRPVVVVKNVMYMSAEKANCFERYHK
jgi:hypothetical protein